MHSDTESGMLEELKKYLKEECQSIGEDLKHEIGTLHSRLLHIERKLGEVEKNTDQVQCDIRAVKQKLLIIEEKAVKMEKVLRN